MLERFPGRTLEELDMMDYGRFMRAVSAGNIQAVEERRGLHLQKPDTMKLSEDDWVAIEQHDRWMTDGA